jgi:hypothetical protein
MNRDTMIELRDSLLALAGAVNLRIDFGLDDNLRAALTELTRALATELELELVSSPGAQP